MNDKKQSKWQRWVAGFLLGTVLPGYLGYIWMNERPPLRFDQEQFQIDMEQLRERIREFGEAAKSLKENEQQDEPVEEAENESDSQLPTNN